MPEIKFTVPGPPVGKERPRRGRYGNFYTPKRTHDFEAKVWLSFLGVALYSKRRIIREAKKVCIITMCFFKSKRHPDTDNVVKAVWDGLSGEGRFGNDNRFCGGVAFDFDKENPRTEIRISWET